MPQNDLWGVDLGPCWRLNYIDLAIFSQTLSVLYGNTHMIGNRFDQLDLVQGKPVRAFAVKIHYPYDPVFNTYWNSKVGSKSRL